MVYVDFDLLDQELDHIEAVSFDRKEDGCLLFVVLFLEVQIVLKVKLFNCVQVCIHYCMVADVKVLLFALIDEIGLFLGFFEVFNKLTNEFPVVIFNGSEQLWKRLFSFLDFVHGLFVLLR